MSEHQGSMHLRNIRDEVCEWVDAGPGTAAVRLVKDYDHRRRVIAAVTRELDVLEGELTIWESPNAASNQLPSLHPDRSAGAVLVAPGNAAEWADWLRANREGLRGTVAFLLVLVFEPDFQELAAWSPDFMSWAKENGAHKWAVLPQHIRVDANAECMQETGLDLRTLVERWRAGEVNDTEVTSYWVGVAAALLGETQ